MTITEGASTETGANSAPSSTPAATPASSPAPSAAPSGGAPDAAALAGGTPAGEAAIVPPAYVPNLKFKYKNYEKDTQEEREFDDWAKPLVNKDNEGKLRELYEKAFGLDQVKPRYQKERERAKELGGQLTRYQTAVNRLAGQIQVGDLGGAFKELNLTDEQIFNYVQEKLAEKELPYDQRMRKQEDLQIRRERHQLMEQNQTIQRQYATQLAQMGQYQLDRALESPALADAVKQYEERQGRPGTFREAVIDFGILWHQRNGEDLTPDRAVSEFMKWIGHAPAQAQPPAAAAAPPVQAQPASPPPVIPVVGGKNSSPTARKITSIKDIEAAYSEKYAPSH